MTIKRGSFKVLVIAGEITPNNTKGTIPSVITATYFQNHTKQSFSMTDAI